MTVYDRIKNRRNELKMTQEELAEKLGYAGKSMISRVESGEIDLPYSKVIAFAEALRVAPAYLFGWTTDVEGKDFVYAADASSIMELTGDPEMMDALSVYIDLSPEKKKHVVDTIYLLRDSS